MGKKKEFYPKLKTLIEELGEWNINCLQLSRKWDIPKTTIHNWKNKIVKELGPLDLSKIRENVPKNMMSNMKLCQKMIRKAEYIKDKTASIKAFNDTVKTFTDFAEAYGYKDKIADKLEIEDNSQWKERYERLQELKRIKKKDGKKQSRL